MNLISEKILSSKGISGYGYFSLLRDLILENERLSLSDISFICGKYQLSEVDMLEIANNTELFQIKSGYIYISNPPKPAKIKNNIIPQPVSKPIPPKEFYAREIVNNQLHPECENYSKLVEWLFGKNAINTALTGVLSIEKQLSFDEFKKLLSVKGDNSIGLTCQKIENDKKYWKGKKSLYLCLYNWLTGKFSK